MIGYILFKAKPNPAEFAVMTTEPSFLRSTKVSKKDFPDMSFDRFCKVFSVLKLTRSSASLEWTLLFNNEAKKARFRNLRVIFKTSVKLDDAPSVVGNI